MTCQVGVIPIRCPECPALVPVTLTAHLVGATLVYDEASWADLWVHVWAAHDGGVV